MKSFRTWILIAGILVAGLAFNSAKAQDARQDKEIAKANKQSLKAELKDTHPPKMKSKNGKHRVKEVRKHPKKSELHAKKPVQKRKAKMKAKKMIYD